MNTIEQSYLDYLKKEYKKILQGKYGVQKIPYIVTCSDLNIDIPISIVSTEREYRLAVPSVIRAINIKKDIKLSDKIIQIYQKGLSIKKYGRLQGNLEYIEDCWKVQIQPITITYLYLRRDPNLTNTDPVENMVLAQTELKQSKIRDKYLKVRIRYDGTKYVLVNAVKTLYSISYA